MTDAVGDIFVISAPSGTGKSTIIKMAINDIPNLIFSISYTTRNKRNNEIYGKDYFFIDHDTFDHMINNGQFMEWTEIYENKYGTSAEWIKRQIALNNDILLDLDSKGTCHIKNTIQNIVTILLLPPSVQELTKRLKNRGCESKKQICTRLNNAKNELLQYYQYDYFIINDNIDVAYNQLKSIIIAHRCKKQNLRTLASRLLKQLQST